MYSLTCIENMIKFQFHNLRQVTDACKNHMEAFLEENKNCVSDNSFSLEHRLPQSS